MTPAEIYATARADRFARTIRTDSPEGCRIALLGLPDDTGVALNGGRVGARDGPRAFREALARYGTTWYQAHATHLDTLPHIDSSRDAADLATVGVFDAGDVEPATGTTVKAMEATHDRVTVAVKKLFDAGLLPVCIGGGHDHTWPAIRAVAQRYPEFAGIYFDAHLDVRDDPGSGMAFRKILTETTCKGLVVEGLDYFANSREHIEWFESRGGRRHRALSSIMMAESTGSLFASFDLDCVDVAAAPGVSAINVCGMANYEALHTALNLGRNSAVVYFDIMELNPKYDIDGRTARLAACIFLSFLAGYAMRNPR